jgi:hypothetical protein
LQEERRARERLTQELKLVLGNSFQPQKNLSTFTPPTPDGGATPQDTDQKYKELKKKLLMANLKILELQNRKTEK